VEGHATTASYERARKIEAILGDAVSGGSSWNQAQPVLFITFSITHLSRTACEPLRGN